MAMKSIDDSENEVSNLLLSIIRQGDVKALESHLSTICNLEIYLNRIYDEPDQQKCTLLMIACLNKSEDMIQILLNYSGLDLEVLNNIQLLEKDQSLLMYQNVTVLWAAAAIDNLKIVKLLVEHGARVNHTTKTNSTAFRCACCNGNIDMARYLNENDADIHIAKINQETNLIASVYNEDLNMTTYLVDELGCDVNESTDDGRSPLYIAVGSTSLELIQFLLNHGARNFQANYDHMSPLLLAAEKRRIDFVDAISPQCSVLEQIEALELLGSAFACREHGICNLEKSFEYFYRALKLRCEHNLPKIQRLSTVEVFDNRQECQTIDELEELRLNDDHMYTEALLVRERLLGPTNTKYCRSLRFCGALLADNAQHNRGVDFWLYELSLRRQYSLSIDINDLRQWASVFSDIICKSISIPIVAWQTIITVIFEELEHNAKNFDYNLHTLLFLITIVSQIVSKSIISHDDHKIFYRHIRIIVQRHYVTQTYGSSLLHLSLNNHTSANDYFIDSICKYPCLHTARLILQCGADVNAIDAIRNTPLHIFVSNSTIVDDTIIQYLCNAGAHLDYVNALGETPIDVAKNSNIKQFLKNFLAALVIMVITLCLSCSIFLYSPNHPNPITTIRAFCKTRPYILRSTIIMRRWMITIACLNRYASSSRNARVQLFVQVHAARHMILIVTGG
ncbi:unnamed protein product [Rotaria sp. Silwood2]|nr:unnamed protein product [Rotaria sp. Silwood2]